MKLCQQCGTAPIKRPDVGRFCSRRCLYRNQVGRVQSAEAIEKRRASLPRGADHKNWKGDAVTYQALHDWIRKNKTPPESCERCGVRGPVDAANVSGRYLRDLDDWLYLCRGCHMESDGRMQKFIAINHARSLHSN